MRSVLLVLATAAGVALLVGVASAGTATTNFEPPAFHPGSVDGQGGWRASAFDQDVVANGLPAGVGFGTQSFRLSNAVASGAFDNQTFSPPVSPPAGNLVGTETPGENSEFTAQFSFIPTTRSFQDGLFLSVSPDSGEGSRMAWVGLLDTPDGIAVTIRDTPGADGDFVEYSAGPPLDRTAPHTIKFWIKINPGENNDLMRVFIDGRDLGQCFTTWENYYRASPEQENAPNFNHPAPINSLQFRSSLPGGPQGGGYLFDNVSVTTANGTGPAGCDGEDGPPDDIDVDKQTAKRSALPGDFITYRITVRNRDHAVARDVRVCDRPPRALRFLGASRRLRRVPHRGLCLTIRRLRPGQRRTFFVNFALRRNVTADSVTNDATVDVPAGSRPSGTPSEGAGKPRRRRADRAAETLGVRNAFRPCPAAVRPLGHAAC
jgi:uncharacterized repeat protein (TIGR01451 family)